MGISRAGLAGVIDHTLLKPEATCQNIIGICREAVDFGFKSVCINPCHIDLAYRELENTKIGICAVIGFPLGASEPAVKAAEAAAAVRAGASEVDVVMNIGFFKGGLLGKAQEDLTGVISAAKCAKPEAIVKVILETCLLTNEEKVQACRLAVAAGADFVKTSTGFNKEGAMVDDIKLIRQSVGPRIGVKASGGIRDLAKALSMLEAGADRIGTSAGVVIVNELR
ncbi:deoxyribose-phosphate aldolase [Pelotomaculum terephthalicicum JT]|uniref:deoxyribose-phosphate aldolase n=1 Tax=Pelotomaculum TaxID=191373 RepID=UPI0009D59A99|nr:MULTISPECIES: deoxyribose-phosphate aldolase [Pelotomaculum]MCG9969818.1 deoxyribose-phosphate aldolase [Pelotomaculum terephthalicicum JT]OPX85304.1 MAG: Deoxyribose-phosphate aldolase 1 [Pelotomaculum sp. PtaB.Bin117]OPY62375.1 MAG: Deoxyribose-phosphate aldolase 1 [Pelotomaculum sp. PtaU1.Bin065]